MQQPEATEQSVQKWQEPFWLLIAVLTPLFVNLWVEQQFEASKIWLLRTLVWALAVVWFGGWLHGLRFKPIPLPIRNLLLALALILTLSTVLSPYRAFALFGSLDRANGLLTQLSYLLLFSCVATQINEQAVVRLLTAVVLTAVPICFLGLAQAAGWQTLSLMTDARSPLVTTLGRANFTGAYLALLLPLTLTAAYLATTQKARFGYATLLALELVVIVLTQARAGWIAATVGLSLTIWLYDAPRWPWRVRWLTALGGIAGLLGGLLLLLQRGIASGGSIAARWTIWQASLRLLWPRLWLGYGADTLELIFPALYPPQLVYYQGRGVVVDRAHNWLLDWSLSYGVVATAALIALILCVMHLGWQRLIDQPNQTGSILPQKRWLAACLAAICAHLVGNLFLFEVAATAVLFWLLLAIVVAMGTAPSQPHSSGTLLSVWARRMGLLVALLVLVWGVWQGNVRPLLADSHSWRGTQALNKSDAITALAEYETAVSLQPARTPYLVAVGLTAAQLGNFAQAEAVLRQAITLRPTDPVLFTHLAAVYAREAVSTETPAKTAAAYAAFDQAIALAPTIGLTHQQYADLAFRTGDDTTALVHAQRAVALDATDGIAFGILGWTHLQNGDLVAAQQAFEQAVKWQPDSADFYLGLATAQFEQGNFAIARQTVEQSLRLNPALAPALTLELALQEK